jgi:hypothetical protein
MAGRGSRRIAVGSRSISADVGVGTNVLSWFTAFPPLAAGMLVEAGGFEFGPGDCMREGVEQQQIGFELADFAGDDGTFVGKFPALALEELAAGEVDDAGRVACGAAADVDAHDPAVDAVSAGVIAEAIGAGFPGHEAGSRKRRRREWRYIQIDGACWRRAGRTPGESLGYNRSVCKRAHPPAS